jgi:hypothetical protein
VERQVARGAGARAQINAYLSAAGTALGATSDQFMADLDAFTPARDVYEKNTRIAARRVQEIIAVDVATEMGTREHKRVRAGSLLLRGPTGTQQLCGWGWRATPRQPPAAGLQLPPTVVKEAVNDCPEVLRCLRRCGEQFASTTQQ